MSTATSNAPSIGGEHCSTRFGAMHATYATDATNERVQDQGRSSSVPEHTTGAVDKSPRVKVACINWSHEDAPKAMSYLLRDDEAVATAYHDGWAQAMERANDLARLLHRAGVLA